MRDYVIEELSIDAVLHDQVQFRLSLYDLKQRKKSQLALLYWLLIAYLVQLDNVRMSNFFKDLDLPGNALHILLVFDFVFLQDLHCNLTINQQSEITFSPVSKCVASLTLPKVPLPRDLPVTVRLNEHTESIVTDSLRIDVSRS